METQFFTSFLEHHSWPTSQLFDEWIADNKFNFTLEKISNPDSSIHLLLFYCLVFDDADYLACHPYLPSTTGIQEGNFTRIIHKGKFSECFLSTESPTAGQSSSSGGKKIVIFCKALTRMLQD